LRGGPIGAAQSAIACRIALAHISDLAKSTDLLFELENKQRLMKASRRTMECC